MKKLALALALLAGPALIAAPAGAAVPKRQPNGGIICGEKEASVWFDAKHLAAKNPCAQWLVIEVEYETPDGGMDHWDFISVAPGAHFNVRLTKLGWDLSELSSPLYYENLKFTVNPHCFGPVFLKNSKGKPTSC